ncbi:CHAT domain-containing tetratricopeptide repeat protein [Synechocystis sp. PCC 7509]|uniref:CHAT domain-containing tetratricopeptide repeat protein n=1 Tax=Synechocystis sp. PCC 7509 TaxID=927677 RepID=UPI0002ACB185|nr:CHAT domain-containing protein [Synechocystis sp. PCC 7509]
MMIQKIKQSKENWHFFYRAFTISLSILLLSEAVAVGTHRSIIAQQPPAATSPSLNSQGQQLLNEAQQLLKQGTNQSRIQALAKYQQALAIWQKLGDRAFVALTLQSIGLTYYLQNDNPKALANYTQALELRRALGDRYGEAIMLNSIGGVYAALGDKQQAIQSYNQAVTLFRAEKKSAELASTLISLGGVYASVGDTAKVIAYYNQALEIQRLANDRLGVASTLSNLGRIYTSLGENQQALNTYNQALEIQKAEGNKPGIVEVLQGLGALHTSFNESQKALEIYNQALEIQKSGVGNSIDRALTLIGIAGSYQGLSDYPQAIENYNQAIALQQAVGNRLAEAEILNQLSFAYDQTGEKQKALEVLNTALNLQKAAGDRAREAFTLGNIAGIYNSLGDYQQALDAHNKALTLQKAVQDRPGEAVSLNDIAQVYSSLGDYQQSVDSHNAALAIFRSIGDRAQEGQTLDNIGGVYRLSKNYHQALDYYNQALAVRRATGDRFREFATLTGVIRAYESLKDYPKALESANSALSIARAQKSPFAEASALALTGRVYLASGNNPQALESSKAALKTWQQLGIRAAAAPTLDNIGKTYHAQGNYPNAIASHKEALAVWQSLGDKAGEAESLYNIAISEQGRNNFPQAQTQIKAAIAVVETLRTKIASKDLRATYFASVQRYYEFYTDLLMQWHKKEPRAGFNVEALQVSDRARARSLLEILTEANADIRKGVDPQLLAKERNLQTALDVAETRRVRILSANHTPAQATAVDKQVSELLNQYQALQAQIRTTSPQYAALTQPQALKLAQIQKLLDPDTVLLEYSLGKKRSYLWTVTANSLTSYELPPQQEIETLAKQYYQLVTDKRFGLKRQNLAQVATNLSDILLKPVAGQIAKKRLVVVSDGALQYVPFTALPSPNNNATPLLVEHEIVSLPSASTIDVLRRELIGRKPAPKTVAVIADPVFTTNDERVKTATSSTPSSNPNSLLQRSATQSGVNFARLPGTRKEAEQILALVPASERSQTFDFQSDRAAVTSSNLSQYRIIHFATHGILNSLNPELSGVVLSLVDEKGAPQNGFLRLNEIFNLNLPAELVVLSACQTGLGEQVRGEGIISLTRGFMYAGAPRVVVSLWSVDDLATAELMGKFYTEMLKKGLKPAAALRLAQIEVWKQDKWKSPYYWAAFGLQGEWR